MNESDSEEKLRALGHATEELRPPADFSDRVMRAVALEPRPRSGRLARGLSLAVFAFAAVSAVFVSIRAQSTFDEYALSAFDSVEIEQ